MKTAAAIGFLLIIILSWLVYGVVQAERRAHFIEMKNDLLEAHLELQKFGAFTNSFRTTNVHPFTNHFLIRGLLYQSEFAAEKGEFTRKGFLSITTNGLFVWVDKSRGAKLLNRFEFPSGL